MSLVDATATASGLDVFLSRHSSTGQPTGLVACSERGMISLDVVSRDTLHVAVLERGRAASRRLVSRRSADLLLIIAALAAR